MKYIFGFFIGFARLIAQSVMLACGQIWSNKIRSILTTTGIVIGVASVTAVIGALTGLKAKILSDFESFGTNKIYINVQWPSSGPMKRASWRQMIFTPEQFEGMQEHCPSVGEVSLNMWAGVKTVRYQETSIESVALSAVESSWFSVENRPITMGRPFNAVDEIQGRFVCVITPNLRDKLGLDKDCIGDDVTVGSNIFRITGLLEERPTMSFGDFGRSEYEIYIPFRTGKKLSSNWVSAVASGKSTDLTEDAVAEIKFFLRKTRGISAGEPDTFRVFAIESEIEKFRNISKVMTGVAAGIVGISLLVGGIGIMNIMLVSVSERTREIGLRKAVGARSYAIMTQFLIESVVLCLLGGFIGLAGGHGLTRIIAKLNPMMDQTHIPSWAVMMAFGFSAVVGIFFGIFPAIKAARLDPIAALRHE